MKKLGILITPFMAVSFLASCGGSTPTNYKFDFTGTNCSANNEQNYTKDAQVNFTITADDGYFLPDTVDVVGTTTYEYNPDSNKATATFSCTMPASDVKVTVEAEKGYTFTFIGNNCAANNKKIYKKDAEVSFEITPEPFYMLSPKVTVTGVNEYEYTIDSTSGIATFSCTMKTDVTIHVMASLNPAKTLSVTTTDGKPLPTSMEANASLDIIAHNKDGDEVEATYTSSDETILSITEREGNKVTIKGESGGSAIITCKAKAGGFATYTRKIEVIPLVMSIKQIKQDGSIDDPPTSMYAEEQIEIAAYKGNTKVDGAQFSTEDETITITEENAKVILTGVSEGYGKIVCKAKGYRDAEAHIYVNDLQTMEIRLATGEDIPSVIDVDTPTEIAAYDGNIPLTGVTFASSDTNIIEINPDTNEITGKRAGIATITAEAIGYKDATCDIEVRVTYDVTCDCSDVTLSNLKASTDQDYITTITVKKDKIDQGNGYSVPDTINVTAGVVVLDPNDGDYFYTPTENTFSAELVIPKENIAGAIEIGLSVKELTSLCFENIGETNDYIYYDSSIPEGEINIQYSYDSEDNWTDWSIQPDENGRSEFLTINVGQKLYVKNTKGTLSKSDEQYLTFRPFFKCAVSGNVKSLVNYQPLTDYCFEHLFFNCFENLVSAPALTATTLAPYCYSNMFISCRSLTDPPALPATELKKGCYYSMFYSCVALTEVPTLPATTLADYCYQDMFGECLKITSAILPAEESGLATSCYSAMFYGCKSLTNLKVGFGTPNSRAWPENKATNNWLNDVSEHGTFAWKGSVEGPETRDYKTIPAGWDCINYE